MAGADLDLKTEQNSKQDSSDAKPLKEICWKIGARLEARTEDDDQWFPARVQDIDESKKQILIHYMQWNSRHDEWVSATSSRLRSVRASSRLDTSSNGFSSPNSTLSPAVASPDVAKDLKKGDKVEFYDNIQCSVRPSQVRRMRKDEEVNHLNSNGDLKSSELADEAENAVVTKPVTPKGRRERKRKFDVKTLLNLKTPPQTTTKKSEPQIERRTSDSFLNKRRRKNDQKCSLNEEATGTTKILQVQENKDDTTSAKVDSATDNNVRTSKTKKAEPLGSDKSVTSLNAAAEVAAEGTIVSGKRERKKKKFWDEELPLSSKPKTTKPNAALKEPPNLILPVKNQRRKSTAADSAALSSNNQKENTVHSDDEKQAASAKENGKSNLKYLMFDLSLDPKLIAEKMVEGVNIPGPGVPIPIDSSRLPNGWEKRVIQRGIGITKGKWDVFIQNASGKSFRSKTELQRHLDEYKLPHTVEEFDFSLDDRLKRLRQIWKQFIVNGDKNEKVAPKKNSCKRSSTETPAPLSGISVTAEAGQTESSKVTKHKTESVDVVSVLPNIAVESETGQGLRCSIDKCGKLFRNDKLLQQHVKHYHPNVFDQVLGSPVTSGGQHSLSNVDEFANSGGDIKKRKSVSIDSDVIDFANKKVKLSSEDHEKQKKSFRTLSRSNSKKFSECSNVDSPLNQAADLVDVAAISRCRNDSVMSLDASSVAPSEDGDLDAAGAVKTGRGLPPTPPTFRLSKRRQAQLKDSSKKISRRRGSCLNFEDSFRLFCNDVPSADVSLQSPSTFTAGGSSYPPSEVDVSGTSEHLTSEEIVNCTCKNKEENGLMIQCDICLCWQHGACLGIDEEDRVPDKHVCTTCKNPRAGRPTAKFEMDYDWIKEGKLPTQKNPAEGCNVAFKKLSDLMADLVNLNRVLHSLRVKLQVASQQTSGKVFMWSTMWDNPPTIKPNQSVDACTATSDSFELTENFCGDNFDTQAVIDKLKLRLQSSATGDDNFSSFQSDQSGLSSAAHGFSQPQANPDFAAQLGVFCSTAPDQEAQPTDRSTLQSESSLGSSSAQLDSTEEKSNLWPQFSLDFDNKCGSREGSDVSQGVPGQSSVNSEKNCSNPQQDLLTPMLDSSGQGQSSKVEDEAEQRLQATSLEETESKTDLSLGCQGNTSADAKTNDENENIKEQFKSSLEPQISKQTLMDESVGVDETTFDPSLIPTFSEVAQLLPSVIEAIGSENETVNQSQPMPPLQPQMFIPEPKRIDRDECRLNLLDHISSVQSEVEVRLEAIETSFERLVEGNFEPTPKQRSMLTTLLRDLGTARSLLWSLK